MKTLQMIKKLSIIIALISLPYRATAENQTLLPKALGEPRSIRVAPGLGAVSERIPIVVSPGRRNVEPKLTFAYSSMASLGDGGLGWGLDIGRVERWRSDGTPTVGDSDTFLYSLAGSGGELHNTGGEIYRAKIESVYREFEPIKNDGHGHYDGWTMYNGEGVLHRFGGTPGSRIDGQVWMLDYIQDRSGNTINYFYERVDNALYLVEIKYTGFVSTGDLGANLVEIEYEERPDIRISYGFTQREKRRRRIKRISVFARENLTMRYEFDYEQSSLNGQSLLSRITLVGADDESRITLRTFEYSNRSVVPWKPADAAFPEGLNFLDSKQRDTGVRVADVNGDGFADILNNGSDVYLGDGRGHFSRDDGWSSSLAGAGITFVIPSGDYKGADTGVRLVDVNMDGRPDIFIARTKRRQIWLNTGLGWSLDPQWSDSLNQLGQHAEVLIDDYYLKEDPNDLSHIPDFYLPWTEEPFALADNVGDSKGVRLTDVNGDGRLDILWSMKRSEDLFWALDRIPVLIRGVFLNTGVGWQKNDELTDSLWLITPSFVKDTQLWGYDAMDVNGDGLADIVQTFEGSRRILINTGAGWQNDSVFTDSLNSSRIVSLNSDRESQGLMPTDYDDDGLLDYFRADGSNTFVYHNTGQGWAITSQSQQVADWLDEQGIAFATSDGKGTGVVLGDVDGDSLQDILMANDGVWGLWLTSHLRSGLLVRATSSLGEVTELEWAYSTSFDNQRVEDGVYGLPSPMAVVTAVSRHDGRGNIFKTEYDYGGGLFKDRQFRGFNWSVQSQPSGLNVKTCYHQHEKELVGQMKWQEAHDSEGLLRARRSSLYNIVQASSSVTQVQLAESEQQLIDPNGVRHTRIKNTYDERLNFTSVYKDPQVGVDGDETTTLFFWAKNESLGIWSMPSRIQTLGPDGSTLSESVILYDDLPEGQIDRALPSKSKELVGDGVYVSKSMEYDQYGNVIRVYDRENQVTEFHYDDYTSTYRTHAIDPEGRQVFSEFDPRFGELVRDTDASGNETHRYYDEFGRLIQVQLPGDEDSPYGTISFAYSPLGDAQTQYYSITETETSGEPETFDSISYFDGLGQVYRVEQEGEDGTRVMLTEFDDTGNSVSTSRPFYEGDTPVLSLIVRDDLHRPIQILEPDGIELTMSYAGPCVNLVDRRGHKTSFYRNADGQVTEVHQWNMGVEQVTRYRYDPLGRLIKVIDTLGFETTITYDALGRRTRLIDANTGIFEYRYDGEGRLVEQIAPNSQITRFYYNRAGDLVLKEFPDGTTHKFTYGVPGQKDAVGRLIKIEDSAGTINLKYDSRGNIIERRRTILGKTYVTGYRYDSLGRIHSIMYPDGFRVYYEYDKGGSLSRVVDTQGKVVAEGMEYSNAGQLLQITYGNGVETSFDYDELLRMTSIQTLAAKENRMLQDLEYTYDPGGNILAINDELFGASQTFEYDSLNRLKSAEGAYGNEQYQYDAIGNLLQKGNLRFSMDPEHPQRVVRGEYLETFKKSAGKSISSPKKDSKQARAFMVDYDELGNVTQKGNRSYEYDSENHLIRVLSKTGKVIEENIYDARGQRVIQATAKGKTIFVDGIYEEGKTHISRHIRADSMLLATVVTPRATVQLVTSVPHKKLMGIPVANNNASLYVTLFCLIALPIGYKSLRKSELDRQLIKGMVNAGAMMSRHPRRTAVLFLLVISIVNNTGPIPLFGARAFAGPNKQTPSEKRYYYHSNHLGSVNVITDEQAVVIERRDYKPYGEPFNWTGPNSGPREFMTTFNGHRYDDATGLYYFGARHYDAELGRFLTADTQVPDPMNPKCLNRYAFGGGNPIRNVDPTGHAWYDWVIGIFVALVAIVIGVVTFGAGLALFGCLGGAILLTIGGAFLGAGAFAIVALANGASPLNSDFWVAFATGAVLGAVVGAGIAALPAALGAGSVGTLTSLGANAVVGAMFGAIEQTVVHFANGGGPDALLEGLLISAGIGAAIGLVTAGAAKGFGKLIAGPAKAASKFMSFAKNLGKALLKSLSPIYGIGKSFHAGFTGEKVTETAMNLIAHGISSGLLLLLYYTASPPKSNGVPAWAFAGTWPGVSGAYATNEESGLFLTMPLAQ